jgi:hypothetical protein
MLRLDPTVGAPELDNPYVAPATVHVPDAPATVPYAKIAGYAMAVSAGYGFVVGAATAFQFWFGLRRFGGLEYVPRVIVLSALRELAPSSAFALTCLTAVTVVHRASRSTPSPAALDPRGAWLLGGAIALLYPIDVACVVFGALGFMLTVYGQPAAPFVDSAQVVTWGDLASGATKTTAFALLAALALPRVLRFVAASRRGLVLKLFVAWLVVQGVELAVDRGIVGLIIRL